MLLDVAHSPSELSRQQWEDLRHRIEDQGLLFKVRVIGTQVREREEGQALVEYALLLSLIAVVSIVILGTLGKQVSHIFSTISAQL